MGKTRKTYKHGLSDTDKQSTDKHAGPVEGGRLTCRCDGPDQTTDGNGCTGVVLLSGQSTGNGEEDVSDEETDQGDRVIVVAVLKDLFLKTLQTGIGEVSTIKVRREIEENSEGENTEI
jgi:hypothetical protein